MEKIDPRIIRTKKLIMDAFVRLSQQMEFKDITIKDITTEATINRATFYAHFVDKDDLLEKVLIEDLMKNVLCTLKSYETITEESVYHLFVSLVSFRDGLKEICTKCYVSFEKKVDEIVDEKLVLLFEELLKNGTETLTAERRRIKAVMLTGAITGAVKDYKKCCKLTKEEYAQHMIDCLVNPILR